jgi:hypothetical protein
MACKLVGSVSEHTSCWPLVQAALLCMLLSNTLPDGVTTQSLTALSARFTQRGRLKV